MWSQFEAFLSSVERLFMLFQLEEGLCQSLVRRRQY